MPRCAATPSSAGGRDPWPKALTAAQQFINLRAAGDGILHAGSFAWTYETTPSALGRVYRIRIEVDHDLSPDVSSRTRISANSQVDAVFLTSTRTRPVSASIAAEIIRRAAGNDDNSMTAYVLRLARPPTFQERLQLMAARLQRRPIVIMAHKCGTVDEWLGRYSRLKDC